MAVLTIRNVPDDVYKLIAARAAGNRRSIQQEVLTLLERLRAWAPNDSIDRARTMREKFGKRKLGNVVRDVRADRDR